ncbi:MAG: MarR family winged helix-turn-helix transcriptional regulator [Jatrophihabitantaceae bacterium]
MPRTSRSAAQVDAVRALARLARLVERNTGDMSLAHYRVLSAVADGNDRASRMAARLVLGKPTISAAVDALCQRGRLTRESVEGDQRATALRITPAGTAALAAVEESIVSRFAPALARTPDPAQVIESLRWLGVALDELAEERLATGSVRQR